MKRLAGRIVVGLAASGLAACGGRDATRPARAPEPIAVMVARAISMDTAERLETGGVVAAEESATLASRIVATVERVRVKAGDRVNAGDVLVTLDGRDVADRTLQARAGALAAEKSLKQAQAVQTAAEAEHRLAAAWQKRIAALHGRNSSTDQERDEAEARLAAAAASLAGALAGIEAAEAQLASARAGVGVAAATESFAAVRAPFAGLVTERLVDPGSLAAPGVPLLRVESDGVRQVVARVDEARAAYVHPGDRVSVTIEAIGDSAGAAQGLEGVVAEVARAVDVDDRAFTVKVTLPRTVTARSGSFARVVFRGAPRRSLMVPADAVRQHGQVSSVFVVQDGVARLRLVQVGEPSGDSVEVLAGLDAGEVVVTVPPSRLSDGAPVTAGLTPARPGGTP